jgi:hypothetical protein
MESGLGVIREGQVVVLREDAMAERYGALKWRLFRVTGVAASSSSGRSTPMLLLSGHHLADGESAVWAGEFVERVATEADVAEALVLDDWHEFVPHEFVVGGVAMTCVDCGAVESAGHHLRCWD